MGLRDPKFAPRLQRELPPLWQFPDYRPGTAFFVGFAIYALDAPLMAPPVETSAALH